MDLISVDCPNCGASLPHQQPGEAYRCGYCGSMFRLEQAKKAHTQAGIAIDPHVLAQAIVAAQQQAQAQAQQQAQAQPMQHAAQHYSPPSQPASSGRAIALMIPLLVLGGSLASMYFSSASSDHFEALLEASGVRSDASAPKYSHWNDSVPQVVSVAGQPAVLGRMRTVGNEDELYCAVYGISGELIWRTESLGSYSAAYRNSFCAAVGDVLIASNHEAQVRVHELATGAQRHLLELSDVVEYLCVPYDPKGPKQAWIKQLDERTHLLDPSSGELSEAPQPDWCFDSRHDAEDARKGGGRVFGIDKVDAPKVDGLELEFVFEREGKAVALGHTTPGTEVPSAVGFDPGSKRVLWQQAIPSVAKASLRNAEQYGAIAGDLFVTTYGAGQDDWYIAGLDLESGRRVWETKLRPLFAVDRIYGLSGSDTHAFVIRGSLMEIYDAKTGELSGTIGHSNYDDEGRQ